jgi:methionyl-tRNA formyltransferase
MNYSSLAVEISDCLSSGKTPTATPQSVVEASYSLWRDNEDYFVDWRAPATTIRRTVDALGFPYKGAASTLAGKVVRILKAEALSDVTIANRTPGKVIFVHDSKPVVVCGEGLLRIDELVDDLGSSLLPLSRFRTRFK